MPRPWQREHTVGEVPGFAPVPLHVGHGADSVTATGTCAPSMAWSNEMCTSVSRSRPRSGALRTPGPPGPPPLPNRSERMSEKPPANPPLPGAPPPAPSGGGRVGGEAPGDPAATGSAATPEGALVEAPEDAAARVVALALVGV